MMAGSTNQLQNKCLITVRQPDHNQRNVVVATPASDMAICWITPHGNASNVPVPGKQSRGDLKTGDERQLHCRSNIFFHNVDSYGSAIRTYGCGDTSLSSLASFTVRVGTEEAKNCAPQERGKRQGATELK